MKSCLSGVCAIITVMGSCFYVPLIAGPSKSPVLFHQDTISVVMPGESTMHAKILLETDEKKVDIKRLGHRRHRKGKD